MTIVGGFASGKRTFIETHLLHQSFIESIGMRIYSETSKGVFNLKYSDNNFCNVLINDSYLDRFDVDGCLKAKGLNIKTKKELILSIDEFNELCSNLSNISNGEPLFEELTVYLNDPFLKIFEIAVLNPWSAIDYDSNLPVTVCEKSDVVIYVLNACHLCSREDIEFLSQIKQPNLLVIVNRMDLIKENEYEKLKEFVSNKLQTYGIFKIQYVSSVYNNKGRDY